jgi:hypothetical protein
MSKLRAMRRQLSRNAGPKIRLNPLMLDALRQYQATHAVDESNPVWVYEAMREMGVLTPDSTSETVRLLANWEQRCAAYLNQYTAPSGVWPKK